VPPFTEEDDELIRGLIFEELPPLATSRQITRYLCGLTSPATSRAKLTKRPEFARFAHVPFRTVLARVEQLAEE
jgi:ATP-dependent DNA helicase RecQ